VINLRSVAVTTDPYGYIYLVASEYHMVFFKFDSNLAVAPASLENPTFTNRRLFKGTSGKLVLLGIFYF
jgi:hypothetical protein